MESMAVNFSLLFYYLFLSLSFAHLFLMQQFYLRFFPGFLTAREYRCYLHASLSFAGEAFRGLLSALTYTAQVQSTPVLLPCFLHSVFWTIRERTG